MNFTVLECAQFTNEICLVGAFWNISCIDVFLWAEPRVTGTTDPKRSNSCAKRTFFLLIKCTQEHRLCKEFSEFFQQQKKCSFWLVNACFLSNLALKDQFFRQFSINVLPAHCLNRMKRQRWQQMLVLLCSGLPESTVVTTSVVSTVTQEPSTSLGSTVLTSM